MINANQSLTYGRDANIIYANSTFTVTAGLTAGQVIPMMEFPVAYSGYYCRILDAKFSADGFYDGVFSLGDAADPTRFIVAGTPGTYMQKGEFYLYDTDTILNLTVVFPPTSTSGALKLSVVYTSSEYYAAE